MKKPKKIAKTETSLSSTKYNTIISAIIVFVIAVAYAPSLRNSFQFDDIPRIIQNQAIRNLSSLRTEYPFFHGKRAVVNYSLWLNCKLGGCKPTALSTLTSDPASFNVEDFSAWQYHTFNILIHCANGVLAYFLILTILSLTQQPQEDSKRRLIAFSASLLFGLHPIQTQAVTYIIQRAELLAAFFQLIALLFYITARTAHKTGVKITFIFAAIASYALALESKEQAAVFPLIIILFEIFILKSKRKDRIPVVLSSLVIILLLTGIFLHNLSITYKGDTAAGFDIKGISKGHYALTNLRVFFTYLRLLVLPINQNLDYNYSISSSLANPLITLPAFIALLGITGIAVFRAKKQPLYSFCIFFFLITLAPSSSFIPIVDVIFEHRLYFPALAVFIIIALLIERAYSFIKQKNIAHQNIIFGAICGLVIIACVTATIRRNLVWRTPITLWQDVIKKSPDKARGYINLGHEQFNLFRKIPNTHVEAGRYLTDAYANFEKSIQLDPKQPDAYTNLSLVYFELDRGDEAIDALKKVIQYDGGKPQSYLRLADMYYRLGRQKEAVEYFESLFDTNEEMKQWFRNHDKLKNAMAKTYLALGVNFEVNDAGERYGARFPFEKAVAAYEKSLEWEPLTDTYYSLAVVLDRSGNQAGALNNYKKVLELNPDFQYADIVRNRIKDIE